MLAIKTFATIFMLLQALFLYGLTEHGFRPPIKQVIFLIIGFITVFLAIWL